ncbi:hypothetical protein FRC10_002837 [Ceratobasidium sp. 414]|nr:hypothetical protein FRC10_002837 [Ceratobasidium sp. 414]
MAKSPSDALSPAQAHALFNFLTHTQTLAEMQSLKVPGRVSNSGPPFDPKLGPKVSDTPPLPTLNYLLRRLALTLPGFQDVPLTVWSQDAQAILEGLAAQDLSDSFDKGSISKRKILGFAVVVIAEHAIRGALGGVPGQGRHQRTSKTDWDPNNPRDVLLAWDELIYGFAYGTQMEELVEWVTKTDDLTQLPSSLQAAHRFATMTIISSILGGDETRILKRIQEMDASDSAGTPEQIAAIENYVQNATRDKKLDIREQSIILSLANVPLPKSEVVHANLLNRLSLSLAARDRVRLISVLCDSDLTDDDHLATLVRAIGKAFDPILRGVHSATDFPGAISDIQSFLDATIAVAEDRTAGPDQYLKLCEEHQKNLHKFLHALANNAPEIKEAYLTWYKECMRVYARPAGAYAPPATDTGLNEVNSAGALTPEISKLVEALSETDRIAVLTEVDEYVSWLGVLASKSGERTAQLLDPSSPTKPNVGPGLYLAIWEDMIASTGVTPAEMEGPVRYGTTDSVQKASQKDDGERGEDPGPRLFIGTGEPAPRMEKTRTLLKAPFENLLVKLCMN